MFYIDPYYLILVLPTLIFAMYAQYKVKSTYQRYSQVPCRMGYTGAQAADTILRGAGIFDVGIEHVDVYKRQEFEEMIRRGELFEWARYVDNYYGTPKSFAMEALAEGRDVILEIEVQGALKIKAMVPEALMIFVVPPSMQVLKERLVGRGTESQEAIAKRLRRTVEELPFVQQYEYVVINHTVESCADEIHAIVSASHAKLERNLDHLENLRLHGMDMDAK